MSSPGKFLASRPRQRWHTIVCMANAKIEIKVGAVSFSGEGRWLSEQLDKVIEKLPELASIAPAETRDEGNGGGG
jgi:hypothetical protein